MFIQPYRCEWDYCDKAYSHKIDLKRHMQHHTGRKAYTCPFDGCGRTFTKKSNMDSRKSIVMILKAFTIKLKCLLIFKNRFAIAHWTTASQGKKAIFIEKFTFKKNLIL